jgi:hypothetical protein
MPHEFPNRPFATADGRFALFLNVAVALESQSSNVVLTMIGVWLATLNRADSPRFDMLAGDASLAFGPGSHVKEQGSRAGA